MGWYGPQGDCGCCEDTGPCDPVGLVLDGFTTANPRWQFVSTSNPPGFIDTAYPGMDLSIAATSSIGFTHASRCHRAPGSSLFSLNFQANILAGGPMPANPSGPWIQYRYGIDIGEESGNPATSAFNVISPSIIDGWPNFSGGAVFNYPGSSDFTNIIFGEDDHIELAILFEFDSGSTYDYDAEFFINSSSVSQHSGQVTGWNGLLTANAVGMAYGFGIGSALNFDSWVQNYRSEIIDLS